MQTDQQYLPPLLLDALGGGKRPNKTQSPSTPLQYKQRFRDRSRSRERSATPPTHGSPTMYFDEDAPPVIAQHNSSPTRKGSPTLHIQQSNYTESFFTPKTPSQSPFQPSPFQPSPNAMSVDASPRPKQELQFPNTPTPIASGTTITLIGIPKHRQSFVLDQMTEFGPITNITKSEKEDANWIVVTFLNTNSVQKALALDGKLFDSSWILIVRVGDCFGVLDEKLSPKKNQSEVAPSEQKSQPSMVSEPFMKKSQPSMVMEVQPPEPLFKKKSRLILSEQALMTPVQQKVTRFAQMDVVEEDGSSMTKIHETVMETDEKMYPEIPEEDAAQWNQTYVAPQDANIIAVSAEPAVRPNGILSRISDLLFGW